MLKFQICLFLDLQSSSLISFTLGPSPGPPKIRLAYPSLPLFSFYQMSLPFSLTTFQKYHSSFAKASWVTLKMTKMVEPNGVVEITFFLHEWAWQVCWFDSAQCKTFFSLPMVMWYEMHTLAQLYAHAAILSCLISSDLRWWSQYCHIRSQKHHIMWYLLYLNAPYLRLPLTPKFFGPQLLLSVRNIVPHFWILHVRVLAMS